MKCWRDGSRSLKLWHRVSAAFALVVATAAPSQSLIGNPALDEAAAAMRPGQFVLDDDRPGPGFTGTGLSTAAPITIAVSIAMQRLYVYRGAELVAVSTVSTGKPGKRTPLGDFTILQKRRWHRSNIYSNAPMPFMQRLTWTGIAIHAGHLPGFPASHGCIRVPLSFAQALFGITALGEAVSVADWPPHTPVYLEVDWTGMTGTTKGVAPEPYVGPIYLEYDFRVIAFRPGVRN
ncbi:L,D-transpeptidase family protein [Sphingomonas sp. SUN039]|uniref:L,D-transpeptidase family protein n=1 Tax=Sphingomonas sp. SUN039 TaxID=2937787 RepID=UPI00216488E2|nr:L,D-transpeptidase family protein [Sphingomonas sp. SUN039]UVO54329.1 L,D-transpeptidase family protein [Sphingomonas sp. SUN039]